MHAHSCTDTVVTVLTTASTMRGATAVTSTEHHDLQHQQQQPLLMWVAKSCASCNEKGVKSLRSTSSSPEPIQISEKVVWKHMTTDRELNTVDAGYRNPFQRAVDR